MNINEAKEIWRGYFGRSQQSDKELERVTENVIHTIQTFDVIDSVELRGYDKVRIGLTIDNKRYTAYKSIYDHLEAKKCMDGSVIIIFSPYSEKRHPKIPDFFHEIPTVYGFGTKSYLCHFIGHGKNIVFNPNILPLLESYDYMPKHKGYYEALEHFEGLKKQWN